MLKISNEQMRSLWLKSNGLYGEIKKEFDLLGIIKDLGFVQLDTIQNVTRAHHHILYSRDKRYKEYMLDALLEAGEIFEHFTHDASVLSIEFYPMWELQFKNLKEKIDRSKYYKNILDEDGKEDIIKRIKEEGALNIKDFEAIDTLKQKTWSKSVYKSTLDYMWYSGILTTAYRKNFRKYYDLRENKIPKEFLDKEISKEEQIDWLCSQALDRMSVASAKEIKEFWDVLSIKEVNTWIKQNQKNIIELQWQNDEGKYIKAFAPLNIEDRLNDLELFEANIKIINPFDPTIRDRKRLKNIFGFEYKIEIFVAKEKRVWGYYVYPLLLGDKFIGRIELKADRKENFLEVLNFWLEAGIVWGDKKQKNLDSELKSFASLAGIDKIIWNEKD